MRMTIVQSTVFAGLVLAVAAAAGSRAAAFRLPADADWFNGRLAKAFESHYDEVFPGRTLGTNVWAAIDYVLFNEGRAGVVVGREGWLYTDEEFKAYAQAEATLATHLALIPWVRSELAARGTELVVALVPSKARVYPEYLGTRRPAPLHQDLYAKAQRALQDAGIRAPDLHAALRDCKSRSPTFLRTDTHWTPDGASCAAAAVQAALGEPARRQQPRYATRVETRLEHRGDLLKFLPLDPYFASLLPPADTVEVRRTELTEAAAASVGLLDDAPIPEVVLIGTSYSADERWHLAGALQHALQRDVVNYAAEGKGPFVPMLEYLLGSGELPTPPKLVIWEIPERYLPMAQDLRVTRDAPPAACADDAAATDDTV